ncbi:hypothetical protein JOB18_025703 [Solea senegalensis]|uniref:Uncharacterized protein n=1 Tax=Solea senegalensis TaxID=28829 RepID=A0AAV6RNW5_SOLSE|nr:hypothetical protein JOB18_025703 [Solea senegalensis]
MTLRYELNETSVKTKQHFFVTARHPLQTAARKSLTHTLQYKAVFISFNPHLYLIPYLSFNHSSLISVCSLQETAWPLLRQAAQAMYKVRRNLWQTPTTVLAALPQLFDDFKASNRATGGVG